MMMMMMMMMIIVIIVIVVIFNTNFVVFREYFEDITADKILVAHVLSR